MDRPVFPVAAALLMLTPQAAAGLPAFGVAVKVDAEKIIDAIDPIPDLPSHPHQISYLATAVHGGTFSFTIFLQSTSAGTIDTRWAFAGTPTIEAGLIDTTSRALVGTSAYSPFWITNRDLSAGAAILGNDPARYLGLTPLGHLFDSALASYYFDPTNGILLFAQTKDLEKAILLTGAGYVPLLPPANPSGSYTVTYSRPAFDPHLSDPDDPGSIHIRLPPLEIDPGIGADGPQVSPTTPKCGGSTNQIFGSRTDCPEPFTVTGDFFVTHDTVQYPLYAMGNITFELQNPSGKTYRTYSCVGHYPKTEKLAMTEPECGPAGIDPTVPRSHGQHTLQGYGRIDFCLNPTNGFTCSWTVGVTLQ